MASFNAGEARTHSKRSADQQLILVVDDAEENFLILENLLQDEGDVLCASSGSQALGLARSKIPDLILLDVSMPDMDGYEVCRKLKMDPKTRDIPVVFVTGMSDESDQEKGLSLGAIDYIIKPYSPAIVLARIRNHLALRKAHLELRHANAELTRLATTDFLTGVWNRRHFMELGNSEMARVKRNGRGFGAAMIDIDHFKSVNDTFGHDAGDAVLKAMADECVRRLRTVDIIGRMGGEEFALILPETDPAGTKLTIERLRENLGHVTVPVANGEVTFTISAGVTKASDPGDTMDAVLKRADEALYKAKSCGRNMTVAYEEL
jgi:diguanylate cyclase (GGDEF)-like protein